MTALLSIIVFALIVLIILAGIGVFNLRCICNYCDFIHSEQYHHQGILNSIQSVVSNVLINQDTALNHSEAIADDVENIKLYFAPPECPDDLPFPEDEGKDEPTPEMDEREHFILTENTTSDAIIAAYKNEIIAIHCTDEDEWKESVDFVSSLGVTTNDKTAPNKHKYIKFGSADDKGRMINTHAIQSIHLFDMPEMFFFMMARGVKTKNNFIQGNDCAMDDFYDIIEWADIRELFIDLIKKQPDDAPAEQTDEEFEPAEVAKFVEETVEPHLPVNPEAVVEQPATEIPEEISTVEDAERYLDEQRAAETSEKASEDIPAAPVESDDTEDKGEADA